MDRKESVDLGRVVGRGNKYDQRRDIKLSNN